MMFCLSKTTPGSDKLSRCGALESLVNDMADETWDNKAMNRISAIHFLDEDDDEDDDAVRQRTLGPDKICGCRKGKSENKKE